MIVCLHCLGMYSICIKLGLFSTLHQCWSHPNQQCTCHTYIWSVPVKIWLGSDSHMLILFLDLYTKKLSYQFYFITSYNFRHFAARLFLKHRRCRILSIAPMHCATEFTPRTRWRSIWCNVENALYPIIKFNYWIVLLLNFILLHRQTNVPRSSVLWMGSILCQTVKLSFISSTTVAVQVPFIFSVSHLMWWIFQFLTIKFYRWNESWSQGEARNGD